MQLRISLSSAVCLHLLDNENHFLFAVGALRKRSTLRSTPLVSSHASTLAFSQYHLVSLMQFEANKVAGSIRRHEGNVFTAEFHLHTTR